MGVNLSDLPPELRRQIEAEHGTPKRAKPSRTPGGNHTPGHCHTPCCDWTGTDRHENPRDCRKTRPCDCFLSHVAATGHARFEMTLAAAVTEGNQP